MKVKKNFIIIFFVIGYFFNFNVHAQEIFLVRHAEKSVENILSKKNKDPNLSPIGIMRANYLAELLKDQNIQVIYSTQYKRTFQTGLPLATKLGLKIQYYDPKKLIHLSEHLKKQNKNVLVVGHSNTTPALAKLLGSKDFGKIDESEYARLYQISINDDKATSKMDLMEFSPKK